MVKKTPQKDTESEKIALRLTNWIGTPQSIIVHTILFIVSFLTYFLGIKLADILLMLTTIVSLEAIYLSLFIQLTVNKNTESLEDVEEDIEEIQEDVEGLEGNIKKIRENVKDMGEDIEDISEDVEKLGDEDVSEEELTHIQSSKSLKNIEKEILTLSSGILALRDDLEILKKNIK